MRRKPAAQVFRVTGARESRSADVRRRYRRYAISMSIRTACFVATVLTHGPTRWVMFAAAALLPYVAVVMANGGRVPDHDSVAPVVLPSRTELPPIRHSPTVRTGESTGSQNQSRNTF
ncbi:MAG TPA: DUF3099 domain-containing protein [Sporichthyaceae bacterium]|jgi:hypothetical protein|nr:DUF3099 domain-containing protein [Sporichthyaceae bacterium]